MITAKIGRRGQFVLPRYIRRQLGLREGDRILLIPEAEQVILRRLPETLTDLKGSIAIPSVQDFEALRREVLIAHSQKVVENVE
ncbi:MAG: AbrB/MazE/SpoVT family DNA-binding domain-containing protein [Anaerolineales bacterium]